MAQKLTTKEVEESKYQKTMNTIAWRAGYYRANPQRFCEDYLQIHLKPFQSILIWAMMHFYYFMYIAARGQGKTWLTALFCCVRCILYPGTKIVISAGTLKQANESLLKIQDDFMINSPNLRNEIKDCKITANDSLIKFKNGSWITTRTSTDNARGARANLIIVDEFRMVDELILNQVLRKFLTAPREPGYLKKKEYEHLQERNHEIYMSSAWFKSSWAWNKAVAFTKNFFNDQKRYFICGLPYQISIKEHLLMRDQVADEMSEADFNELSWSMEMGCLWYGDNNGSFFKYDDLRSRRKEKKAFLPLQYYNDKIKVPDVVGNNKRVLSVDVALMASTKKKQNDASALFINDVVQVDDTSYRSSIVYAKNYEGMTTDELGITIMRWFYKYKCTDLVLDCQGVGQGVFDYIIKDQYDEETGETYKALTCVNDEEMAARCKIKNATKAIWSVKASADFNSKICIALRTAIQNGRITFLVDEQECDDIIAENFKPFKKMTPSEKAKIREPYIQTTMAIFELIKLKHVVNNGKYKVIEESGMRKDRYSSLAYNYWCVTELEHALKPKFQSADSLIKKLTMRKARFH